jgi:hypothetical protein
MVTVQTNGRSFSFEGKEYKPDKLDHVYMPRRAFNHIQAYGFWNNQKPSYDAEGKPTPFRIGLQEVHVDPHSR